MPARSCTERRPRRFDRLRGRGVAVVILLGALALQGCYRTVALDSPPPGRALSGVTLTSGEVIDFSSRERAMLEDSAIVVRPFRARDQLLRTIPADDVASVTVMELDRGRTTLAVISVGVAAAAALAILVMVSMSDVRDVELCGLEPCR